MWAGVSTKGLSTNIPRGTLAAVHPVLLPSTAADIAAMPPLMPMATSLKLSRNNEDTLVTHALDRLGWKNGRMESPSVDKAAWMEPQERDIAVRG